MSHSKEIREKKQLQARMQLAVADTSSLVSSWLKPLNKSDITSTVLEDPSKDDFFNLPIIGGSSGLSLGEGFNKEEINTIGDYVKSDKSLASLANKKKGVELKNGNIKTIHQSKALNALQSKIRKGNVQKLKYSASASMIRKPLGRHPRKESQDDDEEEEEEVRQKSAPKKSFGLLIDSKIKKKK